MAKKCIECRKPIPKVRLEVLPETEHCVKCSPVAPNNNVDIAQADLGDYTKDNAGEINLSFKTI